MRKITDLRSKMYERVTNQSKTNQDEFPLLIRTLFILSLLASQTKSYVHSNNHYIAAYHSVKKEMREKREWKIQQQATQIEFMLFL